MVLSWVSAARRMFVRILAMWSSYVAREVGRSVSIVKMLVRVDVAFGGVVVVAVCALVTTFLSFLRRDSPCCSLDIVAVNGLVGWVGLWVLVLVRSVFCWWVSVLLLLVGFDVFLLCLSCRAMTIASMLLMRFSYAFDMAVLSSGVRVGRWSVGMGSCR